MEELSKEKRELEAALRDVLQAMRTNQQTTLSDGAASVLNLERLANVSMSHVLNLTLNTDYLKSVKVLSDPGHGISKTFLDLFWIIV